MLAFRAVAFVGALASVAACVAGGHSPPPSERAPKPAPSTAWDPPPWVPPPGEEARTGRTVGMSASGGYDQPRWMLLRFVHAVRDADEGALERLLADPVHSVRLRRRPRSWWVERLTQSRRRQGLGPEVPVDQLVSVHRAQVEPVDRSERTPPGARESDAVVTFPLEPLGRRWLGPLLFWRGRGRLLIRPGADPKILGL